MTARWKYLLSYPFFMDQGGGRTLAENLIRELGQQGLDLTELNFRDERVDFEYLIVFGFSKHELEILTYLKNKGITILLLPIFDRTKSRWLYQVFSNLKFSKQGFEIQKRKKMLEVADHIIVSNENEKIDMLTIFNADPKKINIRHVPISAQFLAMKEQVDVPSFKNKYQLTNYLFSPAASISTRKNQLKLIDACATFELPLVLTGTDRVEPALVKKWNSDYKLRPNIICLPRLSREELIAAYLGSSVTVSATLFETAGIANLEAALLGARLAVSNLPVLKEYLGTYPVFFNPHNTGSITQGIKEALAKQTSQNAQLPSQESWTDYAKFLIHLAN